MWTAPFQGVVELLPDLAERYRLHGFTNTNAAHAASWRPLFQMELQPFETIFVSSEIGLRKPDAPAFAYVCREMQAEPEETIFLDDSLENVHGARASGLDARHVATEAEVVATLSKLLE